MNEEHREVERADEVAHTDKVAHTGERVHTDVDKVAHTDEVAHTDVDEVAQQGHLQRRRNLGLAMVAVALIGILVLAFGIRFPYVIESPGPTADVLGSYDKTPVITVDGAKTYPTKGHLLMTTVSVRGGPGKRVTGIELFNAWLNSDNVIVHEDMIYPQGLTAKQVQQISSAQMKSSQSNAEIAALDYLNIATPATITVTDIPKGSPSEGILRKGDVITALHARGHNAQKVVNTPDVFRYLATIPPKTPIDVTITRDKQTLTKTVTSTKNPERPGGSLLGIYLDPKTTMPMDIHISLEDIGGPSAGMIFALGLIDKLTPGTLINKTTVAGTGTITMDGYVGQISGVRQKILGAKRDGARYFLIPHANCRDIGSEKFDGITVVSVSTLADAVSSVKKINEGDTSKLTFCPVK